MQCFLPLRRRRRRTFMLTALAAQRPFSLRLLLLDPLLLLPLLAEAAVIRHSVNSIGKLQNPGKSLHFGGLGRNTSLVQQPGRREQI